MLKSKLSNEKKETERFNLVGNKNANMDNKSKLHHSYELISQLLMLADYLKSKNSAKLSKEDIRMLQKQLETEFTVNLSAWNAGFRPFDFEELLKDEVYTVLCQMDSGLTLNALNKMSEIVQKKRLNNLHEHPEAAVQISLALVNPATIEAKSLYITELENLLENLQRRSLVKKVR